MLSNCRIISYVDISYFDIASLLYYMVAANRCYNTIKILLMTSLVAKAYFLFESIDFVKIYIICLVYRNLCPNFSLPKVHKVLIAMNNW